LRMIPIENVKPGMLLGKTIYREEDGKILLGAYTVLKANYIEKLRKLNINYLCICDTAPSQEDLLLQPVKDETKIKAIQVLKSTIKQAQQEGELNITKVRKAVEEVLDEILRDNRVVYNLVDINSHDNYTYTHSLNVTILSLLIGSRQNHSRSDLELLGTGAMLHDIGKIMIDQRILNKPARLDPDEFSVMKEHARKGFEILKDKVVNSYVPAHIALQHHEREDGSGYPKGIAGKSIHRFSKIVAVADVFDAMTSNRVYQTARPPVLALREILRGADLKYDRVAVECLLEVVAAYPSGSLLRFENGLQGVVICVSRGQCLVELTDGPLRGEVVDIYHNPEFEVVEVQRDPKNYIPDAG
jgi:putative nucleotidyltransferase with HDIG domain